MSESQRESTGGRQRPSEQELDRVTPSATGGREVRIGLFVLLGVASFLAVLFLLTDPATFRGRYMVATEVEDAAGLRRGDPVQMRGVNIGRVHQFDLIPAGVGIVLEIDGRWTIPGDSRARLAGGDLLGGRTVEVIPGTSPEPLAVGAVMPGESVTGVMEMAEDLGEEARTTLERVRMLLDEEAVSSVHSSIGELEELLEALTEFTREQRVELESLSGSLNRSAERVEDLVSRDELDRSLARADSTLVELQEAGGNLSRASSSLETILQRIEAGEGTLGLLTTDEDLYRNLTETIAEFRSLAEDVRENPGRYIRLRIF
jgi:phospholipid/cholesterol/gamma-HCH transport system substrate-binding protein